MPSLYIIYIIRFVSKMKGEKRNDKRQSASKLAWHENKIQVVESLGVDRDGKQGVSYLPSSSSSSPPQPLNPLTPSTTNQLFAGLAYEGGASFMGLVPMPLWLRKKRMFLPLSVASALGSTHWHMRALLYMALRKPSEPPSTSAR
jgi:hypothetical protein